MSEAIGTQWSELDDQRSGELADISTVLADLLASARQAFDRDRETARRCLTEAAALVEGIGLGRPPFDGALAQGGLAPWQMRRIRIHVDAKLSARIPIHELCEVAQLSASHFSRAFKRSFGMSPHAFVVRRRVERAQELMLTSDAPLCQIALECGLADQSHLSRLFQRHLRMSPNEWRRFCRAARSPASPQGRG